MDKYSKKSTVIVYRMGYSMPSVVDFLLLHLLLWTEHNQSTRNVEQNRIDIVAKCRQSYTHTILVTVTYSNPTVISHSSAPPRYRRLMEIMQAGWPTMSRTKISAHFSTVTLGSAYTYTILICTVINLQ